MFTQLLVVLELRTLVAVVEVVAKKVAAHLGLAVRVLVVPELLS
jgi:hypothetical protein